jgi:hypothetical protein
MGIRPCHAEPRVSLVTIGRLIFESNDLLLRLVGEGFHDPGRRRNFCITQRTKPWDPTPRGPDE